MSVLFTTSSLPERQYIIPSHRNHQRYQDTIALNRKKSLKITFCGRENCSMYLIHQKNPLILKAGLMEIEGEKKDLDHFVLNWPKKLSL